MRARRHQQSCLPALTQATSALDSANEAAVQLALDRLMDARTTIVIAHRLSTVVRASQILVMEHGNVVERGTHRELSSDKASQYARFMRHQLVKPDSEGESTSSFQS